MLCCNERFVGNFKLYYYYFCLLERRTARVSFRRDVLFATVLEHVCTRQSDSNFLPLHLTAVNGNNSEQGEDQHNTTTPTV